MINIHLLINIHYCQTHALGARSRGHHQYNNGEKESLLQLLAFSLQEKRAHSVRTWSPKGHRGALGGACEGIGVTDPRRSSIGSIVSSVLLSENIVRCTAHVTMRSAPCARPQLQAMTSIFHMAVESHVHDFGS